MRKMNWAVAIGLTVACQVGWAGSNDWVVRKTSWSQADEQAFQDLVTSLGEAVAERRCNTVSNCMKNSSINPYAKTDPRGMDHYADCADLPYYLRAYVAWKHELPFTYASKMGFRNPRDPNTLHYSKDGNKVVSRVDLGNGSRPTNAKSAFINIINGVYTGSFRTPLISQPGEPLGDYYSVAIDRKSITPGVALYDSDGHAYVVYKVEKNGNVKYIDAHPDGSLTLSEINNSFSYSRMEHGWGFRKYRPTKLVGARAVNDGQGTKYVGGEVVLARDSEISDYSVSHLSRRYYGDAGGERKDNYSFYLFAREKLAVGNLSYDILQEFSNVLDGLCSATIDRAFSVDKAIEVGINRQNHPTSLPANIYGTTGDWENYSTPSRDARLKSAFVAGFEHVADLIEAYKRGERNVVYNGNDVYRDLFRVYRAQTGICSFKYRNSSGQDVELNLNDVRERLWKISFDPYHCIERRWGADGQELGSCRDSREKDAWYDAEQQLRNQIERRYDDFMGHSLRELQRFSPGSGKGVANPPELELIDQLSRYGSLDPWDM